MEMARSLLKHMHMPNYLWGECIRHATYLLNRVATRALKEKTPYEVFRNKRPNVSHLRVFGCIGYAKVDNTQLKKLGDRSRMLVHLGMDPRSKSYHLYDPHTRRIVLRRDFVFDETKGWNWIKENSETQNDGSFIMPYEGFGLRGLIDNETVKQSPVCTDNREEVIQNNEGNDDSLDAEVQPQPLRRSERQTTQP